MNMLRIFHPSHLHHFLTHKTHAEGGKVEEGHAHSAPLSPIHRGHSVEALMEGAEHFKSSPEFAKERAATAAGQHPFAVVVCCSDSRVPPEVIFEDVALGELFVVRTAGHTLGPEAIESIKYAFSNIKPAPAILLVLGHEKCGAVSAAVEAVVGANETITNEYPAIVGYLRSSVEHVVAENEGLEDRPKLVSKCVHQNVVEATERILKEVSIPEGTEVVRAVYDVESGEIHWLPKL